MILTIVPFFGKKDGVKKIIFSILTNEYPLKIIQLTNYIKKRYAKSITFQGVRCALLELTEENILIKKDNKYSINQKWVIESKRYLDGLYTNLQKETIAPKGIESIKGEISVFEFNSINELTKYWQDIINNWSKQSVISQKTTCYQAAHLWEGLLHVDREKDLTVKLKEKKIKAYILSTGNSPLDKNMKQFYKRFGVKISLNPSLSSFDKSYYVGVYGETIIQTEYPRKIVVALDIFFRKNKTINTFDLNELSNIVNQKAKAKLVVIKNPLMAKQLSQSIISQMD